jgi:hypothetical protein
MNKQHYIQAGTKAFCKTQYSKIELLCTVEMVDNHNAKVRLPCTINGITHDMVNIKDMRCLPPEEEVIRKPLPEIKNPINNPYRKLIQKNIVGISKDEEQFIDSLSGKQMAEYKKLLF